jgi:phage terminase small subunit
MQRELTPRQRRFVDSFTANGGSQTQAAVEAGYPPASAASTACRLARNPLIQQAIMRAVLQRIGLQAVPALHAIESLSKSSKSDYVRLEASKDLLDRAGFLPPQRVEHRLDQSLTVTLQLAMEGGSKRDMNPNSDPPHTGKFLEKPDVGWGEGSPAGTESGSGQVIESDGDFSVNGEVCRDDEADFQEETGFREGSR